MANQDPISVLIVDDSRIFRSELELALGDLPGVTVVGSVFSGEKALEFLERNSVDLITLDIAMPGLSGIETLREIRARNVLGRSGRRVEALLLSSLTKQGARCTVDGLQLGAYDFLLKPDGPNADENRSHLRSQLAEKMKPLRSRKTSVEHLGSDGVPSPNRLVRSSGLIATSQTAQSQAIVIGVSTGGPEALSVLLPVLATQSMTPVFIVQHNLQGFNEYLAESLSRKIQRPIIVPHQQMEIARDGIYLAKGGSHLLIGRAGNREVVMLSDSPPENQFKPSVDALFRSASTVYESGLIAVVLTGMLNDGAQGAKAVKRAGGYVIAQDEASSVVWGMPRAAIETGSVDQILSIHEVGPAILKLLKNTGVSHSEGALRDS